MLKTIRTNFDRHEQRRDRRYPEPRAVVVIDGNAMPTRNWSLGGFQTAEAARVAVGKCVAGSLRFEGCSTGYDFAATAVRHGDDSGTSFRFVDTSLELITALDRAALRRFRGAR